MHIPHICIVEDDAIIAARLFDILKSVGYEVSDPVASGDEAVAQVSDVKPDLILMDINLYGDMNGVEAARRIHTVLDVPIVYLTAYSDNELLQRAKLTDPYGYLVKPVQERELYATIEMALHKHAMIVAVRESEQRYRAVVANAKDAVYLFDAETLCVVETNDSFRTLLGYSNDDIQNLHLKDFIRLPLEHLRAYVYAILNGVQTESTEWRYCAATGRVVVVIASASVITCGGRRTVCVVAHDITERQHAEELLQESESRMKIILQSIRAGVMIVDAHNRQILDINEEAARIMGRSQMEIIGSKYLQTECTVHEGTYKNAKTEHDLEGFDCVILNAKGEPVPVIKLVRALTIDGRRCLLETFIDVSERAKAEQALTDERNLLHTVVNSLPHQIYAKDSAKRFILSNACNTHSLGFRRDDELIGRTEAELLPQKLARHSFRDEELILTGALPVLDAVEECYDQVSGKLVRSLGIAKRPLRNESGKIVGMVGINIDKTSEKLAELELRESEERFRSIVENIGDGLMILDLHGTIEYVNRAAAEVYRYRKDEMIGRLISDFTVPEVSGMLREKHFQRLEEGQAIIFEIDIRRGDAERRSLLTAVVARCSPDGRLTGVYETFSDITERKHAEAVIAERNRQLMLSNADAEEHARLLKEQARELDKARRMAEEASRLKSEFVANMSHEIRTPLNGIIGMTSLLTRSQMNPQQARILSVINTSGNSLLAIINDILDFSKIEAGKMELKETDFSIRAELEDATDVFWYKAKEMGLELTCIVDAGVPDRLHGDSMRLRQVLTNLIGNAIKFTQEGIIVVHVRFMEENAFGTVLAFAVTDTGIGIAPDSMSKLFKPFSQVNGSITREYGGTGLGLAISKRLVELLGGTITVSSRVGKGTTFRFGATFTPAVCDGAGVPHAWSASDTKILVAHTDPVARKMLQMMAKAFHMTFAIALSGDAVEEMLVAAVEAGVPYDVLFLSEQLFNRTCREVLDALESYPSLRSLKTVIVGPFNDGVVSAAALHHDVHGMLTRFSKQSEFFNVLCEAIGAQKLAGRATLDVESIANLTDAGTPLRILVVDDNIVNQQVAADLLESMGYCSDIACNGAVALDMVSAQEYDIIFMDCQMPVMDGYEATRLIHNSSPALYHGVIIAMTAHAIDGDRENCIDAGMDDYISKPIRFEDLQLMIEKWKEKIFVLQERSL